MQVLDIDRARSALLALDPGVPREEWVRVGMAAKVAGVSFDDWHDWSAPAHNYKSESDCRSVWRSIDETGGIGAGTLFALARDAGWREPNNGHAKAIRKPQERPKSSDRTERPPFDFRCIWEAAEPATVGHPYIRRKLGLSDGLRVYRGPLTIAGTPIDGALLVPAYAEGDGALQSWQAITPEGTKRTAPGTSTRGAMLFVGGTPSRGRRVFVCEGIATAWSAHQATGEPAVCAFGAGNVDMAAHTVQADHPNARIVIVADAGKEVGAEKVARTVGGAFVTMPEGSPSNYDINDLHVERGMAAVGELLAQAQQPEPLDEGPREIDLWALANRDPEPPQFIVPDWLPAGEVTLFAAHGGSGKSMTQLHLAVCLALGRSFHGLPVEQRDVVFISFEDAAPVIHWRLHRICQFLGMRIIDLFGHLRIFDGTICTGSWYGRGEHGEYGPTVAFHDIAQRVVGPGRVIIVDGSSDTFAGNENDRAQVKAFLRSLRRMIDQRGALVLVAHVDKTAARAGQDALGFSGSTGWNNGVRARWFMYAETEGDDGAETGNVVIEVRKSNLGRTGARMVLRFDEELHVFQRVDAPGFSGPFQRVDESDAVLAIIRAAWEAGDPIPAAMCGQRTAHSVCEAREDLPATLKGRGGRKRFNRTLEQLRAAGAVRVDAVRRANRHVSEVLRAA